MFVLISASASWTFFMRHSNVAFDPTNTAHNELRYLPQIIMKACTYVTRGKTTTPRHRQGEVRADGVAKTVYCSRATASSGAHVVQTPPCIVCGPFRCTQKYVQAVLGTNQESKLGKRAASLRRRGITAVAVAIHYSRRWIPSIQAYLAHANTYSRCLHDTAALSRRAEQNSISNVQSHRCFVRPFLFAPEHWSSVNVQSHCISHRENNGHGVRGKIAFWVLSVRCLLAWFKSYSPRYVYLLGFCSRRDSRWGVWSIGS